MVISSFVAAPVEYLESLEALRQSMSRIRLALVAIFVAAFLIQPLTHSHPLFAAPGDASTASALATCQVCHFGVSILPQHTGLGFDLHSAGLEEIPESTASTPLARPSSSRAPPRS